MVAFPRIRKGSRHDAENRSGTVPRPNIRRGSSPAAHGRRIVGACAATSVLYPTAFLRTSQIWRRGGDSGGLLGLLLARSHLPLRLRARLARGGLGGQRASSSPCWPGRDCRRRVRSITRMTRRLRALPDLRIRPLHSAAKLKDAARPVRGRAHSAFIGTGVHPSFL